jgi:hypothetical protein
VAVTKGKGANFASTNNPFFGGPKRKGSAPEFTEVSNIGKALDVLTRAGCALMVGHTRDGGAVVFTILDGEKRHRTYCTDSTELQDAVTAILDMYDGD